ncbi:transcriptional regulator, TetR family [Segniliparus rotundus DSM 44985]|uniref:Transcriptional regulator, TetR family n=1 Tax=Segniliparus rotundus (strain ATCC BAA-972 / CDC 1076 / CIP 108378 / DSM 44985 / JCM 13578) TaxID=640132 RepID=D6ZEB7_SEGRD|nr:TetR/AcrR family transcriptional regulator [Segniliparus rotundus]ADG97397.1 transcriptional regulator, TetR family [Segniliparus rotundus DSM 44985]
MARNKRPQDADEKRAEIVAAARRLFVDIGYDATSMSRLAQQAGVAPNTIYWYFRDKDDVLIAVLNAVVADAWSQYQGVASEPIAARILWLVRQLTQMSRLVNTVHARVEHSPALAEWHHNFHLLTEGLFRHELESLGVPTETLDAEVMIGVFVVEGLLTHDQDEEQQRAVCDVLAARWSSAGPPTLDRAPGLPGAGAPSPGGSLAQEDL